MVFDAVMDFFFGLLDWFGDLWDSVIPSYDLDGFAVALPVMEDGLGLLAYVFPLPLLGAFIAFVTVWEVALVAVKVVLKLWRLLPLT